MRKTVLAFDDSATVRDVLRTTLQTRISKSRLGCDRPEYATHGWHFSDMGGPISARLDSLLSVIQSNQT